MNRTLRALALAFLVLPGISMAEESGIGDECSTSQDCIAQAMQNFYTKVLPLPVTDTVTMTDVSISGGIASVNLLLGQTREELIIDPQDDFDLKSKLNDYAKNLSCGDNQGLERLFLNANGRLLWKVYFADGEFYDNYFITACEA